jgi:hypothetical protein
MPHKAAKPAWIEALEMTLLIGIGTLVAATLSAFTVLTLGNPV